MMVKNSLELAILNLNRYCSHPERLDKYFFFVALQKVLYCREKLFKIDHQEPFDLEELIDQMLLWYSINFKIDTKYFLSPGRDELVTTVSPETMWRVFFSTLIEKKSFPIEDPIVFCTAYEKGQISLEISSDKEAKLHHYIFNISPEVNRLIGGVDGYDFGGYGSNLGITSRSLENVNVDYWRSPSVPLSQLKSIQYKVAALGDCLTICESVPVSTVFEYDPIEFKQLKTKPIVASYYTHVRFNAEKMAGQKGEPLSHRFINQLCLNFRYSDSPCDFLSSVCKLLRKIFCDGRGIEFGCSKVINDFLNTGTKLDSVFHSMLTNLGFEIEYDDSVGLFKVKALLARIQFLLGDEYEWHFYGDGRTGKTVPLKIPSLFSKKEVEFYKGLSPDIAALKTKVNPVFLLFTLAIFGFKEEEIDDWVKKEKKTRRYRFF